MVNRSRSRFSKFSDLEFSILSLSLWWAIYFAVFYLTETCIPPERCFSVHIWLDDIIPFNEWFVIPYVLWYALIVYSLLYFLRRDVKRFRELQTYLIITQFCGLVSYILVPTRQDLRPMQFPRNNLLTDCVRFLYSIDTNTGVCPSMHVAWSVAMGSVWLKDQNSCASKKWLIGVLVVLICLSTMFIKQHSAVDVLAAFVVCLLAEIIVYSKKTA